MVCFMGVSNLGFLDLDTTMLDSREKFRWQLGVCGYRNKVKCLTFKNASLRFIQKSEEVLKAMVKELVKAKNG